MGSTHTASSPAPPAQRLGATRRLLCRAVILPIAVAIVTLTVPSTPTDAANGSVSYTYDALGRVTSVTYDTGVVIYYTYDANGNRLSQVVNVNSGTGVWNSFNWAGGLWGS